jgi:hypothetical protein
LATFFLLSPFSFFVFPIPAGAGRPLAPIPLSALLEVLPLASDGPGRMGVMPVASGEELPPETSESEDWERATRDQDSCRACILATADR